jgi:hypothetical protein
MLRRTGSVTQANTTHGAIAVIDQLACTSLANIFILKDFYIYFYNNPDDLFRHPTDISAMFYLCFMAYNAHLLRQGVFDETKIDYRLALRTHERGTPSVFTINSPQNGLIISVRGTATTADFVSVLIQIAESLLIPETLLVAFLHRVTQAEYTQLSTTIHPGIFNHALECLAMVLPDLPQDVRRPIRLYGHSLGAACAVIMSYLLTRYGYTDVGCYCMSCPRILHTSCAILSTNLKYLHLYTEGDPIVDSVHKLNKLLKSPVLYKEADADANRRLQLQYSRDHSKLQPHRMFLDNSSVFNQRITCVEYAFNHVRICPTGVLREDKFIRLKYATAAFETSSDSYDGGGTTRRKAAGGGVTWAATRRTIKINGTPRAVWRNAVSGILATKHRHAGGWRYVKLREPAP